MREEFLCKMDLVRYGKKTIYKNPSKYEIDGTTVWG
jgi:hypothetical protein